MTDIQELLTEGEELQEEAKPSLKDSRYIKGYIVSILLIIGIAAISFYPLGLGFNQIYLLALLVVPAVLLLKGEVERHFVDYFITSEQVIMRRGILNQKTETTTYSNITDVTLNKALNERVFDVGDIRVNTAGHDGTTLVLNGLKDPERYKRMIENNMSGRGGAQSNPGFGDEGGFDNSGLDGDSNFDDDDFGL